MKLTTNQLWTLNNEMQSFLNAEGLKYSSQLKINKNVHALELPVKVFNENVKKLLASKEAEGVNQQEFLSSNGILNEEVEIELEKFDPSEFEEVKNLKPLQHFLTSKFLVLEKPVA